MADNTHRRTRPPTFDYQGPAGHLLGTHEHPGQIEAELFNDQQIKDQSLAKQGTNTLPSINHSSYDYYCGSQASMYMNEVLVDECVYVAYNLQVQKVPVHGYASRLYNTLAEGEVLVQGQFGVAFKEAGYMFLIQAYLAERYGAKPGLLNVRGSRDRELRAQRIERLVNLGSSPFSEARNITNHNLQKEISILQALDETEFSRLAEDFEKVVWGDGGGGRIEEVIGSVGKKLRPDEFPNFDIFLTFGNIDDPQANFTVKKIQDVELLGSKIELGVNGAPIVEHYQFIGRNLI